jgi:hypothetical protein
VNPVCKGSGAHPLITIVHLGRGWPKIADILSTPPPQSLAINFGIVIQNSLSVRIIKSSAFRINSSQVQVMFITTYRRSGPIVIHLVFIGCGSTIYGNRGGSLRTTLPLNEIQRKQPLSARCWRNCHSRPKLEKFSLFERDASLVSRHVTLSVDRTTEGKSLNYHVKVHQKKTNSLSTPHYERCRDMMSFSIDNGQFELISSIVPFYVLLWSGLTSNLCKVSRRTCV